MSNVYDAEIVNFLGIPTRRAVADFDANPDDAARALELSTATGVDPEVIAGDLEGFEKQTRQQMTGAIVTENEYIREYIRKYPFATRISNGDYSALAEASDAYNKLNPPSRFPLFQATGSALEAAVKGLKEGWGEATIGDWIVNSPSGVEFVENYPMLAANIKLVATPVEVVLRGLAAGVKGTIEGAVAGTESLAQQLGMDPAASQKIGKEVGGLLEMVTNQPLLGIRPKPGPDVINKVQIERAKDAFDKAKPWIEAGEEPPYGVHPIIDTIKDEQAKLDLENLKELERAADKTATKELSPQYLEHFFRTHPDMSIGVRPEAIAKLYGEKAPTVDDGILGAIPDLQDQIRLSQLTGSDIQIPLRTWLAHVDPEIRKELHDQVSVRPGYRTTEEMAAASADIETYHGSPYEFEAFDTGKIGTGEGAQSYGYGHYVAESPKVAEEYKRAGGPKIRTASGKIYHTQDEAAKDIAKTDDFEIVYPLQWAIGKIFLEKMNIDEAIRDMGKNYRHFPSKKVNRAAALLREAAPQGNIEGNLYRVRVKRNPEEFLDWDRPLNEQSPEVLAKLSQLGPVSGVTWERHPGRFLKSSLDPNMPALSEENLARVGIPGIKFLDQWSRGGRTKEVIQQELQDLQRQYDEAVARPEAAEATANMDIVKITSRLQDKSVALQQELKTVPDKTTHNFVVFNDADLEVLDRNGEAIRQVREAAKFQMPPLPPEKRLMLRRVEESEVKPTSESYDRTSFHDFVFVDETGKERGYINISLQKGGKNIYIEYISGLDRLAINEFGPRAIRDLLRQLKTEFPEAETLSGFRVSGARDKAGSWEKTGDVTIKLDQPDIDVVAKLLSGEEMQWVMLDKKLEVELGYRPREKFTAVEEKLTTKINEILERIAPRAEAVPTADIKLKGVEVSGLYYTKGSIRPLILVSLDARDVNKTARHEAIHFLRDYGFIREAEWKALVQAAKDGDWARRHNIHERYKRHNMTEDQLIEEAISEEFGKWGSDTSAARKRYNREVENVFSKLREFFKEVLEAIKDAFGHTPMIDELFEKIESGEVGRRRPRYAVSKQSGNVLASEKQPELPGVTRMEDRKPFAGRFPDWLTMKQQEAILNKIKQMRQEDVDALTKRMQKQLERERSAAWKENKSKVHEEVSERIESRPDVAADAFFANGHLYGEKMPKPKFRIDLLTDEQRKALPESYVSENGSHPDDIASLFGYGSGVELVDRLAEITRVRTAANMTPLAYKRRLVEMETERVMQERYGQTAAEVLEEAQDYVLSQTQMQYLHEQVIGYAEKAGLEYSLTYGQFKQMIEDEFYGMKLKDVSAKRLLSEAGRAGKAMEAAYIKEDWGKAFQHSQQQFALGLLAKHMAELEREGKIFSGLLSRLSKRHHEKMESDFLAWIHKLMDDAGVPIKMSPTELAADLNAHPYATLDALIAHQSTYGGELNKVIPEGYKPGLMKDMTVAEYMTFKDAIESLDFVAREWSKITLRGEKRDFREWVKNEIRPKLELRRLREYAQEREGKGSWLYRLDAPWTRMEEVMKDLDFRQELGPFFEAIIVPFARAKDDAFTRLKELSSKFKEMRSLNKEWGNSLDHTVPNDFIIDVRTMQPMKLTRWNMIKMMLNWGNDGNKVKLAQGIASAALGEKKIATKEQTAAMIRRIDQFFEQNTQKHDWDFVQDVWDQFGTWQKDVDQMTRNLNGKVPKWVEAVPFTNNHGTYAGGYFPLIPDKLRMVGHGIREDRAAGEGPLGPDFIRATTTRTMYKERTGAVYFVDITNSFENMLGRMQQVIHDLAYREFIVQASKVLYDPEIKNLVRNRYGVEYEAQFDPWLKRIANQFSAPERELQGWNDTGKQLRQNLIVAALPLNWTVMFTPSLGALGPRTLTQFLFNRERNMKLVFDHSKEIHHTIFNYDRDVQEHLIRALGQRGWTSYQQAVAEKMLSLLMYFEKHTRAATFYHEFMNQKAKGRTDVEAADLADSILRERHGAVSEGDLPAIMANKNEFMRTFTVFMGYFTTQRNWMRQLPHQVREGEWKNAWRTLYGTLFVAAALNMTVFTQRKKDESIPAWMARAIISAPLAGVPVIRGSWNYVSQGYKSTDPLTQAASAAADLGKDGYEWAFKGKRPKNPIKHAAQSFGIFAGIPGSVQLGRTGEFFYDVKTGQQYPRDVGEWLRGVLTGESKPKRK